MTTKSEFVTEVLSWNGTKFHHMGRLKGVGADCVGIVVGSMRILGLPVNDMDYYPRRPINGIVKNAIEEQTDQVPGGLDYAEPGDIVTFQFVEEPQHVAVLTATHPRLQITHAFAPARKCVTVDLDQYWIDHLTDVRQLRGFE